MHPAPSVILFSTLSGAGFGLLAFLGLGLPAPTGLTAFVFYAIAFALAGGGLLSATFHLKNKRNAWKSYREWRSSWLSREAWAAILALAIMSLHAIAAIFFQTVITPLGWLGAALSLSVVVTTAMIYTQLRTVPRWNQPATPALFVAASLAGGALLSGNVITAILLIVALGAITCFHWWKGDRRFAEAGSTVASATGLRGDVSLWERPHTGDNYVTHEMVFQVGRRHAAKLRIIAFGLMVVLPVLILLLMRSNHVLAAIAVLSHLLGVGIQRWLFFAEAEHVVGLYYGADVKSAA
jgi:DMSO reductase anchor subunit